MSSPSPRLLTLPFALAFAANLFMGLALHGYLHLPGYLVELGAGETLVGVIFGLMSGAAIVIRPFAGRVMDAAGRRVVIVAGSLVHITACALYLFVDEIGPLLILARTLQGVASGALFSSLFTYAADIVPPDRRTEGMGLFGVSGMLPIALGGLLGDLVLARGDYHDLFLVSLGLAAIAFLITIPLKEPERHSVGGQGFFAAVRQRDLMPIWFVGSAFATALAGVFSFLKNYVEAEHIGTVGLFFSYYATSAILLRVFFGWVPDRFGPKRVLYPSMAAIALAMVLLALARDWVWLAFAGVAAGIGHGYAFPILSAIVVNRANPADRGSAVSLFTAVFDTGILVGSPLLGAVAEVTDLRVMYWVAAALPVIGAILFSGWDRRVEPESAP